MPLDIFCPSSSSSSWFPSVDKHLWEALLQTTVCSLGLPIVSCVSSCFTAVLSSDLVYVSPMLGCIVVGILTLCDVMIQLLLVVSLLLLLDSGTLFHWTVELLHPLTHLRSIWRHFSLIWHNRTVARASVLRRDINWLIDWKVSAMLCNIRTHSGHCLHWWATNGIPCTVTDCVAISRVRLCLMVFKHFYAYRMYRHETASATFSCFIFI